MSYRVLLTKAARKQLDALSLPIVERISERLIQLKDNPRPLDCKKLKGRDGWRIRIGDYRVIYHIQDDVLVVLVVLVVTVGHRRQVYR
jgi:mRNA interferase RelE/StbE